MDLKAILLGFRAILLKMTLNPSEYPIAFPGWIQLLCFLKKDACHNCISQRSAQREFRVGNNCLVGIKGIQFALPSLSYLF